MWNELVSSLDAWRNSVPWQFPAMAIILILAILAIWMEEWNKKRRFKRHVAMLSEPFVRRLREIERQSHE